MDIATDRSGCCVMQDCVKITANGESGKRLVAEITKNVLLLSEHPYGFVHLDPDRIFPSVFIWTDKNSNNYCLNSKLPHNRTRENYFEEIFKGFKS